MKMHLYIYLIYQFCTLLRGRAEEVPPSPCPRVLHYEFVDQPRDSVYAGVRGVITIPFNPSISLKVKLQLPMLLNTLYTGRLRLKDKEAEVKEKIRAGTLHEVIYYMDFQKYLPIPSVVEILCNGQLLCWSTPIPAQRGKTIMEWFHSLRVQPIPFGSKDNFRYTMALQPSETAFPPDYEVGITEEIRHIPPIHKTPNTHRIPDAHKKSETYKIPEVHKDPEMRKIRPKQKLPWEIPGSENCGLEYSAKKLIIGGTTIEKGQGPWMVPLFKKYGSQLYFFCTSTLVSMKHVITAAHCVMNAENTSLIAYVGLYNINNWPEDNAEIRRIKKIHVYPKYKGEVDYDLAILELSHEVRRNHYVNSACIWNQEEDLRYVEDREATVFGWGKNSTNSDFIDTPHVSHMPIVSQDTCRESRRDFAILTSSRTLCAGLRNGKGPCSGDSGGGLLLPEKDNQSQIRWVLRGVTSASLRTPDDFCDLTNYVMFTDVAKYKTWILGIISGGEV